MGQMQISFPPATTPPVAEEGESVDLLAERLVAPRDRSGQVITPEHWSLVTDMLSFASQAEQVIAEQKARIEYLETLSETDVLTGLANRRGFEMFLRRSIAESRRHGELGVLAFIDLDAFKSVNDTFGHEAGDKVLRHTADLLLENVRSTDLVARIGGDEFVVVLTRCNPVLGIERAIILQELVNNSVAAIGSKRLHLSVSLGCAAYDGETDPEILLRSADHAMYEDKQSRYERAVGGTKALSIGSTH